MLICTELFSFHFSLLCFIFHICICLLCIHTIGEYAIGRKRKTIAASCYNLDELRESINSFRIPEGFTRLNKGKVDTSVIWDYGVKLKRSDRSPYDKTTFWYCRANDSCCQQNIVYKMSTNSTSSASDHLKSYHHVLHSKSMENMTTKEYRGTYMYFSFILNICIYFHLYLHIYILVVQEGMTDSDQLKDSDQVVTLN